MNNQRLTVLDAQLQELATTNWPAFIKLVGHQHITAAKICLLRGQGRSYEQIAQKLSITKHKVEYSCKEKCRESSDTK